MNNKEFSLILFVCSSACDDDASTNEVPARLYQEICDNWKNVILSTLDEEQIASIIETEAVDLCAIVAHSKDVLPLCQKIRESSSPIMQIVVLGGRGYGVSVRKQAIENGADSFLDISDGADDVVKKLRSLLSANTSRAGEGAVAQALAMAQSIAPRKKDEEEEELIKLSKKIPSIRQILDYLEKRLETKAGKTSPDLAKISEDLDVIDIEVELGSPEQANSAVQTRNSQVFEKSQASQEETVDYLIKTKEGRFDNVVKQVWRLFDLEADASIDQIESAYAHVIERFDESFFEGEHQKAIAKQVKQMMNQAKVLLLSIAESP